MIFKDLHVSTQLKIGLGIIWVLVLFLGITAWIQTTLLWQDTKKLYQHPYQVRQTIDNIKADMLTVHWAMHELFSRNHPIDQEALLSLITARETDIQNQFEILYDFYLGPKMDINNLLHVFTECQNNRKAVMALLASKETSRARAINIHWNAGPNSPHVQEITALLQTMTDFARNKANLFYEQSTHHKQRLTYQLSGIIAVIFLLTSGIGIFLYLRIRTPLKELTNVTDQFHQGNLDVRSKYISADEFGGLSAAFNQMAEAVSLRINTEKNNAAITRALIQETELTKFAQTILEKFMDITGSHLGAFYLRDKNDNYFSPLATMGVDPGRLKPFSASTHEGTFGRALKTKKTSHIKQIPPDTVFTYKTFAGTAVPREIITLPIVVDNDIAAVITIACLNQYPETALKVLKQPSTIILNTAFANILANDRTHRLSEELLNKNQELHKQQEELELQTEELREQSEELQKQNMELEQQWLAVEEASYLKNTFFSNMSHELRTPLNSVMALSRVLLMQAKTKLSAEEAGYLEIIERNGKKLLALINEILDLSKIEAGRMELHPQEFSLGRTIENIMESIAPLAAEKDIELIHNIVDDRLLLESDEIRVSQILQNLVANAVKFTDKGSVTVSAIHDGENICVRISDTGIGISDKDLPYIFDEFRQVDGSSSRQHEGSGLGLAIAHKTTRVLGANISVTSVLGKGSTFTLTLPVTWKGKAPILEPVITQEYPGVTSSSSPRILLVEDNEVAIVQIRSILEKTGYLVDVARGGQQALDYIRHTIPDGIVLDLMMPHIDGFEVLEKIRGTRTTAKIPVLILTAKDLTPRDLKRLSANHIEQLVQKGDVDRQNLLEKIQTMLGEKKS